MFAAEKSAVAGVELREQGAFNRASQWRCMASVMRLTCAMPCGADSISRKASLAQNPITFSSKVGKRHFDNN